MEMLTFLRWFGSICSVHEAINYEELPKDIKPKKCHTFVVWALTTWNIENRVQSFMRQRHSHLVKWNNSAVQLLALLLQSPHTEPWQDHVPRQPTAQQRWWRVWSPEACFALFSSEILRDSQLLRRLTLYKSWVSLRNRETYFLCLDVAHSAHSLFFACSQWQMWDKLAQRDWERVRTISENLWDKKVQNTPQIWLISSLILCTVKESLISVLAIVVNKTAQLNKF
jgi:hypothetical protein